MPLWNLSLPMPVERSPNARHGDELQPGLLPDPSHCSHDAIDVGQEMTAAPVHGHATALKFAMKKTPMVAAEATVLTWDEDHEEPDTILLGSPSR